MVVAIAGRSSARAGVTGRVGGRSDCRTRSEAQITNQPVEYLERVSRADEAIINLSGPLSQFMCFDLGGC